ncbi:MAG: FAD-dependent oxidoreductase [Nitrospinae bacterium]|nr:FAD-dependent oxidoreductase [Nitrospinota bacterium]
MSQKYIILGAGPAGLSAALKLAEAGEKVTVIELENQVGGLCRSIRKNGYFFDLGGHRFITKDQNIQHSLEEIMGDEFVVRSRKSVIRLKGNFFSYPLDIKSVIKNLPLSFNIKAFLDYSLTTIKRKFFPQEDKTFEDWVVSRFGKTLYDLYFGPYSEKLWGIPPSDISADWASQRISLINLWDAFIRMFGKTKDEPKTYARRFYYPRRGCGQVFEMLADRITSLGGEIILNAKAKEIKMQGSSMEEIVFQNGKEEKSMKADFLISTIPLPDFMRSITPTVEENLLQVAKRMNYRSIKFLNLMLDKEQVTDNTWIYIPESEYLFFRIQEWRNWSPTVVPEGKSGVTLEIACNEGDEVWNASDEEIFKKCLEGIENIGLFKKEDVIDYFVLNVKHCYPIYTLDYAEKVETLVKYINTLDNAISIGRQGLYRYNNMDHSIKMGFMTAEHFLNGLPKQEIFDIATEKKIFDQ